jgi:hypothetical protein
MIAYKLLHKRKNGSLGPLFINRKQIIPIGEWLKSEFHPTPGYAIRPGWHTVNNPIAPHLSKKNRVWCKVEIEDFITLKRPESQGGIWYLSNKIKILEEINNG